jgi:phosphate-selective porin OprO/OprP
MLGYFRSRRKSRPIAWNMEPCSVLFCVIALWLCPQWVSAQEYELSDPNSSDQATELIAQDTAEQSIPKIAPDEGISQPADPKDVFATQGELNAQNARIMQLEQQLLTLSEQGLAPGRLRSTDVPLIEAMKKPDYPKVRLTGFFQADAGFFSQGAKSMGAFGDIPDDKGFRRARLAAVGDVSEFVSYMLEMDFAFGAGRPTFMDVWGDIHQVPVLGNVRIGQYRVPFGMDALTSVRELTFLERSSLFAFNPFRQIQTGFHNNNEAQTVTWAASVFGFPTDAFGDQTGDNGYGMAGRITALPIYEDNGDFLVHLGIDYALTRPSTGLQQYRSQPEFGGPFVGAAGTSFSVPFFVDTGAMAVKESNLLNAEAAAVYKHSYIQSELLFAMVNLTNGASATFPGFYVQSGYFLTGEQRSYNKLGGVLGRVKPLNNWGDPCGFGAVELAARYSYLDLSDKSVQGGRMNDVTLGVNWYLNQYTKLQLNYIRSIVDKGGVNNINTNVVGLRAQVDF